MKLFEIQMSKIGVVLCGLYLLIILGCLGMAAGADFKGRFVFLQLPIALQGALLHEVGLDGLLKGVSWVGAYVRLAVPMFVVLYGFGWLMGRLWSGRSGAR